MRQRLHEAKVDMVMICTGHWLIRKGISEIAVSRLSILESAISGMKKMSTKKLKKLRFRIKWGALPDVVGEE